jgi:hypothetical protein
MLPEDAPGLPKEDKRRVAATVDVDCRSEAGKGNQRLPEAIVLKASNFKGTSG